jgi:hypothetical protein
MTARNALLGACLALPLAAYGGSALAGPPSEPPAGPLAGPQTITIPPGALVLILPDAAEVAALPAVNVVALPAGDPMLRMVAEQHALMDHMMAEMHAAFTRPTWPFTQPMRMDRTIQAAFGGLPVGAPGAGTVFTAMSGGPGVCSERMTYVYQGNGAKPRVTVTRSGDACGALGVTGPRGVRQAVPAQRPEAPPSVVAPAAPAHGPRLWTVSDPPQEITPTGTPRN